MSTSPFHLPQPVSTPTRPQLGYRPRESEPCVPFLLRPPYRAPEFQPSIEALEELRLPAGTLSGVRLRSGTEWAGVQPIIHKLRQRLPGASVILLLPAGSAIDLMLSARAVRGGVRAVVVQDDSLVQNLRKALTCRDSLGDDAVEWLTLRHLRLSPTVSNLLREIFAHAPEHPDLSTLLSHLGMAESSARFRLHKRLLPTPSRWFQVARALHCALRVQAEPRTSLLRIAHEFGFADHSALSQLVFRAFHIRPGSIRGTLGWEWLLQRWMRSIPAAGRTSRPV